MTAFLARSRNLARPPAAGYSSLANIVLSFCHAVLPQARVSLTAAVPEGRYQHQPSQPLNKAHPAKAGAAKPRVLALLRDAGL
jgi:hypothetical protein